MLNSNGIVTQGDSMSPDTTAYFANYMDLKNGKADPGKIKTSCSLLIKQPPDIFHGASSLEFAGHHDKFGHFGESSAQMYGNIL